MEILNNIWTVLTTPNEFIRNLFISPFTFIESYIIMTLFLTILNISTNRKSKILYVIKLFKNFFAFILFIVVTPITAHAI